MAQVDAGSNGRRRFLVGATAVVGGVGMVGAAVPFVASWNPSAKARAAGAPVKVDISKIEPGQQITVEWRGKPVWLLKRTPEMLKELDEHKDDLADPLSEREQQPVYAKNIHRSRKEELLVVVGICTHLGCSPQYLPEVVPNESWGGYYCPCHGSKFDLAGRVTKGVPAPANLVVPPYMYVDDNTVIVGVDEENA
ncbi:ubiquinol-cytochrome c reductase iron-sulfur subunit [Allohahella sp. A8]|uniref:ubiquinol-cytochrome c reductase iron-sulfur subunit n=1 Tax=Allohahella sp. A8 TaxID=3141461 RepID=UPI000C0AC47D|nr:ubiquinol-cytochrome c reductase iron-sulfur subunit [Hahellaceae bacterium]|tara:strand:+ start:2135 stop:2719 length:585 start_codon:yes stop_codon:yes gene_type:complete